MMMGVHPCSVKEDYETELAHVKELEEGGYVAVGEIGIDLYWDKSTLGIQQVAFEANEMGQGNELACGSSLSGCLSGSDRVNFKNPRWNIEWCVALFFGSYGIRLSTSRSWFHLRGGVITFKNGGLAETAADLPLDKLVLETDSPYLAPVPYRGKRNESSYTWFVAEKLYEVNFFE